MGITHWLERSTKVFTMRRLSDRYNASSTNNHHYNLQLPDALQVAIALTSNCDAFLTNDVTLKRVTELKIIVVRELELG